MNTKPINQKGRVKKYRDYKNILIRPRKGDIFPDHADEYNKIYKMFQEKYKIYVKTGKPSEIILYLVACRNAINKDFPYYKLRMYSSTEILKRLGNYFYAQNI